MTWLVAPMGVFVGLLVALVMGAVFNAKAGKRDNAPAWVMLLPMAIPFWAGVAVTAIALRW